MKVEIISIGSELITGRVSDTNTHFLVRELKKLGYPVNALITVGDDEAYLEAILASATARSEIVITSGGLGSTQDDLTKRCFAKVFNRKLVLNSTVLDSLKERYEKRNIQMPASLHKQAIFPQRCNLVTNRYGLAPGFISHENDRVVICLPGVPNELERMWSAEVRPYLEEKFGRPNQALRIFMRTYGLMEMEVNDLLCGFANTEGVSWGVTASFEGVDCEFLIMPDKYESADIALAKLRKEIQQAFGSYIYTWDETGMEHVVGGLLMDRQMNLAVAESCTGGLIAHRLTQVAGSSNYFERGLVAYSNRAKQELLGVRPETLQANGAVSANVAREMANGARERAGTNLGIGTTGIAGPGGGNQEKPVGLSYCALTSKKECFCKSFRFAGERSEIKQKTSQAALNMLRLYLKEGKVE